MPLHAFAPCLYIETGFNLACSKNMESYNCNTPCISVSVKKLNLLVQVIYMPGTPYSDTWDAGRTPRTGKRRVNSYLIVYEKWRTWIQQTAEWGHCCRGLVLVAFKPAVMVSSLRGLLYSISSLLIDKHISVNYSPTRSWCSTRVPCVRIPGMV